MTPAAVSPQRLAVFTDLDGTLLDHASYSYTAARPALAALARAGVPLVLASSKTAAEIAVLHRALGLDSVPAIVENGAGIWRSKDKFPDPASPIAPGHQTGDAQSRPSGQGTYARLRAVIDALPRNLRRGFRGFGDMTADEVAKLTGLSRANAGRAKLRAFSEPGLVDADVAAPLLAHLERHGVTTRRGGRFVTLSFGGTKADRMAAIASELGATLSLALGDAPNDIEMLQAADFGVIVANPHGASVPRLSGENASDGLVRIHRTQAPGPEGWNDAVLAFLARIPALTSLGPRATRAATPPSPKGASPHG